MILSKSRVGLTHAREDAAPSSDVPWLGQSWACIGQGFGQGSAGELDPRVIFREGILGSSVVLYGPMQLKPWACLT